MSEIENCTYVLLRSKKNIVEFGDVKINYARLSCF